MEAETCLQQSALLFSPASSSHLETDWFVRFPSLKSRMALHTAIKQSLGASPRSMFVGRTFCCKHQFLLTRKVNLLMFIIDFRINPNDYSPTTTEIGDPAQDLLAKRGNRNTPWSGGVAWRARTLLSLVCASQGQTGVGRMGVWEVMTSIYDHSWLPRQFSSSRNAHRVSVAKFWFIICFFFNY